MRHDRLLFLSFISIQIMNILIEELFHVGLKPAFMSIETLRILHQFYLCIKFIANFIDHLFAQESNKTTGSLYLSFGDKELFLNDTWPDLCESTDVDGTDGNYLNKGWAQ